MKIQFATVPWQALDYPSLAIGVLTRIAQDKGHTVAAQYGNLRFADMLCREDVLSVPDYLRVAENGFYLGLGDWIFSAPLHGADTWKVDEYRPLVDDADISEKLEQLQLAAGRFVVEYAEMLASSYPDLLCLTSTFSENAAALAVARQVKRLAPDIRIALGGGNCDGIQGVALHRNYDFLDFVVRGEGEEAFPELLDRLEVGADFDGIAGLSWRRGCARVDNADRQAAAQAADLVTPEYGDYFQQLAALSISSQIEPRLIMETSRGCWWGEKHHCTFCGLNGSLMIYRSRPEDAVLNELRHLVTKHQILDVIVVDNILDMSYLTTLLPEIEKLGWDLRMHYEVKSNLKPEQLESLVRAGVVNVQPGIESLSTNVLQIMQKGVTGPLNVRFLRAGEETGADISWNYLYGFPGEAESDYAKVIDQIPNLYHLTPPDGMARIALERFSPYFNQPELGFGDAHPAASYELIYGLPDAELRDIAFLYDTSPQGISGPIEVQLGNALEAWRQAYRTSSLVIYPKTDGAYIADRRAGRPPSVHDLSAGEASLYKSLDQPRTVRSLYNSSDLEQDEIEQVTSRFVREGLVFQDGGQLIALATVPSQRRIKL